MFTARLRHVCDLFVFRKPPPPPLPVRLLPPTPRIFFCLVPLSLKSLVPLSLMIYRTSRLGIIIPQLLAPWASP